MVSPVNERGLYDFPNNEGSPSVLVAKKTALKGACSPPCPLPFSLYGCIVLDRPSPDLTWREEIYFLHYSNLSPQACSFPTWVYIRPCRVSWEKSAGFQETSQQQTGSQHSGKSYTWLDIGRGRKKLAGSTVKARPREVATLYTKRED